MRAREIGFETDCSAQAVLSLFELSQPAIAHAQIAERPRIQPDLHRAVEKPDRLVPQSVFDREPAHPDQRVGIVRGLLEQPLAQFAGLPVIAGIG
jgi:hypothetical protein